jgi:hypothetical protein
MPGQWYDESELAMAALALIRIIRAASRTRRRPEVAPFGEACG